MSTTIKFTNNITGEETSHLLWTFGDGTTSTSTNATLYHDYASPGDYTASLEGWSISNQYKKRTKIVTIGGPAVNYSWFLYEEAPAAPSGLDATTYDSTSASLTWIDNSDDEEGFILRKSIDGTNYDYTLISADATSHDITGLFSGTHYWFKLCAYNEYGNSFYSNTAEIDTSGGGGSEFPWWKGEDNTLDEKGENNASWNGTPAYDDGYIGRCFKIDSGNFITISNYSYGMDPSGVFSMDMYVKCVSGVSYVYWEFINVSAAAEASLVVIPHDGFYLYAPLQEDPFVFSYDVNEDEWYHIQLSYDEGNWSVWINGSLEIGENGYPFTESIGYMESYAEDGYAEFDEIKVFPGIVTP